LKQKMKVQIDDRFDLINDVTEIVRRHLWDKCALHPDKSLEWIRPNIRTFVDSVIRDLEYFAREVIPVGEKLDTEQNKLKGKE